MYDLIGNFRRPPRNELYSTCESKIAQAEIEDGEFSPPWEIMNHYFPRERSEKKKPFEINQFFTFELICLENWSEWNSFQKDECRPWLAEAFRGTRIWPASRWNRLNRPHKFSYYEMRNHGITIWSQCVRLFERGVWISFWGAGVVLFVL